MEIFILGLSTLTLLLPFLFAALPSISTSQNASKMAIMVKYKHIYDIPSDPALQLQAHKDLSGPWVFGATLQAILTGIILFQCRQFFTAHARTQLSRGLKTYIGVLLFFTVATCFIEMRVFWWFTMAISGQTSGKTCKWRTCSQAEKRRYPLRADEARLVDGKGPSRLL